MFYRILNLGDGIATADDPPHIFSAAGDPSAEEYAREVWAKWFADVEWPPETTRVEGFVLMDGPWFDKECTSPGFDCGEWLLSCHGERSQTMAPLEDVLEDVVTRVGTVGFIILATAPGWWPIVRAIVA